LGLDGRDGLKRMDIDMKTGVKTTRGVALLAALVGVAACSAPAPGPTASVADPASIVNVNQTWTDTSTGLVITIQKITPMVAPQLLDVKEEDAGGGVNDSAMVGFRVVRGDTNEKYMPQFARWADQFSLVAADATTAPCFEMQHSHTGDPADSNQYNQSRTDAILAAIGGDVEFGAESSPNEGWLVCYITKNQQKSFNAPGAVLKYTRPAEQVIGSSDTLPEFSFTVPIA